MADSEDPVDKSEAEVPSSGNLPGQNVRLKKAGDLESRRYEKRAKFRIVNWKKDKVHIHF